ncbi:hypothetical protein SESBI_38900 [Sesbania bispinosa]|nr:hypothetical protein SESBI_38900 [Sesbania bispinosa]
MYPPAAEETNPGQCSTPQPPVSLYRQRATVPQQGTPPLPPPPSTINHLLSSNEKIVSTPLLVPCRAVGGKNG